MPSSKRVAWSQLKVGLMAIFALGALGLLLILLTGADNPFAKKGRIYTYLSDSGATAEGTAVRLNGIHVGKVKRIALSGLTQPGRVIRMDMEIDHEKLNSIPEDSDIGFNAESVLGQKYLNIKRGRSPRPVKDGGEIKARDDKDFLEMLQSTQPVLDRLQSIATRLDNIVGYVEQGHGSIGMLIKDESFYRNLNKTLDDVQQVTGTVAAGKGTVGKLLNDEALYDDVRRTLAHVDQIVTELQEGKGTAGKLLKDSQLYDELRQTNSEARKLLADLNAGKGTAGRLLKDDELHRKIVALTEKLDLTVERLNAGQGTLGQLLVNPQLYEQINGLSGEMRGLMKDFRANPKKFLTIQLKLF